MSIRHGSSSQQNRAWHSRGYLPHLDAVGITQFVTFRLADSVPASLILRWQQELQQNAKQGAAERNRLLSGMVERYADAGHGACHLSNPANARIVRDALSHFDGSRYRLVAWCVMPNHVHVLIELPEGAKPLPMIVRSWKAWTARKINQRLGRTGQLWMRDCFDRYVRDETHRRACIQYIRDNPVKAGLTATPEQWPWTG